MWLVVAGIVIAVAWASLANQKPTRSASLSSTSSPPSETQFEVAVWKHDDCSAGKLITLSKSVTLTLARTCEALAKWNASLSCPHQT